MAKRGRKPLSKQELELRGLERAKGRANTIIAPGGEPAKPQDLSERATEIWHEIVSYLRDIHQLSPSDGKALTRLCTLIDMWEQAQRFIAENGATYKTREGGIIRERPEMSRMLRLEALVQRLEKEFLLTPASRVGMPSVQSPEPYNPKNRFFPDTAEYKANEALSRRLKDVNDGRYPPTDSSSTPTL